MKDLCLRLYCPFFRFFWVVKKNHIHNQLAQLFCLQNAKHSAKPNKNARSSYTCWSELTLSQLQLPQFHSCNLSSQFTTSVPAYAFFCTIGLRKLSFCLGSFSASTCLLRRIFFCWNLPQRLVWKQGKQFAAPFHCSVATWYLWIPTKESFLRTIFFPEGYSVRNKPSWKRPKVPTLSCLISGNEKQFWSWWQYHFLWTNKS